MPRETFAARAGRWSARHRRKAILGWLAFVVLAVAAGSLTGTKQPDGFGGTGGSAKADRLIDDHTPKGATESVLVQGRGPASSRSPEVRATVGDVIARVRRDPAVRKVDSPFAPGNQGQISKDGRSVVVSFELRGDDAATETAVKPLTADIAAIGAQHPEVRVGQFGGASASVALSKAFSDDFKKAEKLSIPITLLILVIAFGALVAAGVPLLLGLTAVAATLGLIGPISQLVPMDETISSVVLLVGMAVGVDYTLFYLRREREERRAGRSPEDALAVASATSGRAVMVSGLTVIAAMAGMLLAGDRTFTALGIGSMLVVAVAVAGSVTVVPAVLAALGDKVDRGRIPFLGKAMQRRRAINGEGGRLWTFVLDRVLRRPLVSAVAAAALLIALAVPAFSMHTANSGTSDLPRNLEVMHVYDRMQAAFPGGQIPAVVVVHAKDVTAPAVRRQIDRLETQALATGKAEGPITVDVSRDKSIAQVEIPIQGDGADAASLAALADLRGKVVPATVGSVAGVEAFVTGDAAQSKDFTDLMKSRAPLVFAFVLTLAFVLLLLTFRSIVIPIKAIVLNLLSVGASYGVLVWVFQQGHGEGLLGFRSNGAITAWLPMFLFVILFGLSMDYHVFILSRVREAFDRGMSTHDAVAHGIRQTAATVTSAAIVMVAVFGIFATLSSIEFKQMGIGLAVAILLDATIVRAVLLPATMSLLGDRNWYLPRWLEWLPDLRHEAAVPALPADPDDDDAGDAERVREPAYA
jgi:RND superfamily putative drug exporter